ncbi:MAG: WD40 repeat domain-containing protein [Pseudomonadales bacterium]|nr:WD40 repeat domain-containing protein [Pseudomonadales bacterium]
MAEDLIPVGSPGSALAPFPENTSPVGDQLTATNSYFQVTFYDRYAFYDDFQMGRIGVQVADLAGQDNDFNIGLTSDIPEGWRQTDNPVGMTTPIPGEGGVLEIGLPRFASDQPQEGVFALKVWVEGATYEPIEFSITVIGYPQLGRASYGQSDIDAMMTGIVRDASTDQPIAGAEISMWLGPTNRFMPHDMLSVTQGDGGYTLMTWDIDLVNAYFTPYTEVPGYVLMVQRAGYHTYVHGNYVRPRFQSPTNLDISMVPLNDQVDFDVKWDVPLWSPGVWEIEMNDSWDRFALAMGKHPDADDPETWATQLPFIDSNGNILWTKSLPDQSWAVDVSGDGSLVSVTTHATRADNYIYVWDQDGNELWRAPLDSESLDVDISMSNQHVATGPPGPSYSLGIYDARTGVKVREFDTNWSKIRQVDFTPDGQHIVAGPMLHMFTLGGETIWRRYEFSGLPYVIWISSDQSRIMIPDKGDFISMYNGNGDLLWRRMLSVLTYGTMSTDGSLVVALSHGGYLHCYNGEGELLWYRRVPVHGDAGGAGHNGVDITPDGKYIAVGGGNYTTLLYDAQGNLLWSHQGTAPIDGSEHPYLHSVMAVRISPDGTKIVSGYGTSDPRLIYFERKLGQ